MPLIPAVIAVLVLLVIAIGLLVLRRAEGDPLQDRLAEFGSRDEPVSLDEVEMSLTFSERVLVPLARNVAELVERFTPQKTLEATAHRLEVAGLSRRFSASEFWGVRLLVTVGMAALVYLLMTRFGIQPGKRVLYSLGLGLLGYVMPGLLVQSLVDRRKQGIFRSLPDAMDLLTICVEAGLGFDSAMQRVAQKWDSDLSNEFGRVLQEVQLGMPRRDALRSMSERLEVADVTTFVAAIVQAEQLGVSMAKVLRIQSDQMRIKRRQMAEKKAQEAPVKMVIPMVFLIFPALLVVLLAPAGFQVLRSGVLGQI